MAVAIIGGGIAGLTAAYELSKKGIKVTVFEKEDHLGGQLATFNVNGTPLEKFYHHIFRGDRDVIRLIDELGLGPRLLWLPSRVAFYHGGRVYPFVTPGDLLRFQPLGLLDRLRLGLVTLYLQRLKNWQKLESITAREWIMKYGGQRNYDVIWGPLLQGKFGDKAGEVTMAWFWGRIHVRLGSRGKGMRHEVLGYLDGSFGQIIDELARRVREKGGATMLSSSVKRVIIRDGRVEAVETGSGRFPCDVAVATVASDAFAAMVPEMPDGYRNRLTAVSYQTAQCLVLKLKKSLTDSYWLNIGDESIPFLAVVEHTNLVSPDGYGDKRIVYLPQYLARSSPWLQMDKRELLDHFLPFLSRVNPQFAPDWVEDSFLFRDPCAQPVIPVNYSKMIPPHQTPIAGLFLANTTQIYPEDRGINYSVRLGNIVSALIQDSRLQIAD